MTQEKQEVELVHGMRGGIPSSRMEQIHLALPYSLLLRDALPQLADPFAVPHVGVRKMKARVRLSDGWHMLNQARLALLEAEACTIFYDEIQRDHIEALYHCRYYLDDAALRLCSSCEHMSQSVILHWSLSIPKNNPLDGADRSSGASRDGSLVLALKAAEQSKDGHVRTEVARVLRRLRSSRAWKACVKYRHDWVHSRLPATGGLSSNIIFETLDNEKAFPPEILRYFGLKKGLKCEKMSIGMGQDISVLRETMRNAFGELFRAYEGLARLLVREKETTEDEEKEKVR
jgi:hypothetical protein